MNKDDFEKILQKPESSTLDFKRCQYELINDSQNINTAKFIKDIISFCNTIRTETAFIIIGVAEGEQKIMLGLDQNIDDSIFQEKIKDKVYPIPSFLYYSYSYNEKLYGIFEIPVQDCPEPISPTIKMKGLVPGKIYFRRGSSNSEATGRETIMINDWLNKISKKEKEKTLTEEISSIIEKIVSKKYLLSECISQLIKISEKYRLPDLKEFCKNEMTGWWNKVPKDSELDILSYRISKVIVSPYELKMNPFHNLNSSAVMTKLKEMEGFYEQRYLFAQPIAEIESFRSRINENPNNTLLIVKGAASKMYENENLGETQISVYANRDNIENIYNGIRQKLIDKLLELN